MHYILCFFSKKSYFFFKKITKKSINFFFLKKKKKDLMYSFYGHYIFYAVFKQYSNSFLSFYVKERTAKQMKKLSKKGNMRLNRQKLDLLESQSYVGNQNQVMLYNYVLD